MCSTCVHRCVSVSVSFISNKRTFKNIKKGKKGKRDTKGGEKWEDNCLGSTNHHLMPVGKNF